MHLIPRIVRKLTDLYQDRFTLLALLIAKLPSSSLHVVPMLIPEAVLGTKEPSEKSRNAAFDLIVSMGKKMNSGGVVKRSMMDGMDEDDAPDGMRAYFRGILHLKCCSRLQPLQTSTSSSP